MTVQKPERNYGIDLLRILAMYLVTVLHLLGKGGILNTADTAPVTHETAWVLESFAFVSVNCFALISGYVGLRARHGIGGFLTLYVQVWTYSAGIALAAKLLRPEWVTGTDILHALLPVGFNEYWYFTAYAALFLFMPVLNAGAEHLSRRQFFTSAAGILLLASVYRSVLKTDIIFAKKGYSAIWLIVLYYLGAGIRKHIPVTKKAIPFGFAAYIAASIVGWLISLSLSGTGDYSERTNVIRYDSIPVVIASLGLFFAVTALPVRAKPLIKVIAFLSPLTFAVYLIQTHPIVFNFVLRDRLIRWALYSPQHMIFNVLLTAAGIFVVSAAVEWLRAFLMKLLHWKQGMQKLERLLAGKSKQNQILDRSGETHD